MTKSECEAIIAKFEQMQIEARHRMEMAEAKQKQFDDAMAEFYTHFSLLMQRNSAILLQGIA